LSEGKITKDTTIVEALKFPGVEEVLSKYGIGCMGCPMISFEKIGDIAIMHGVNLDKLLKELNEAISGK
jgi:hybrid cluster-associated redox disulfide protein